MAQARLLFALVILVATTALAEAYPGRVTADLNLRNGPGTQYAVITVIPRDAVVDVQSCSAGWCEVAYRHWQGFVSASYLTEPGSAPPVVTPPPYTYPPPPYIEPRPPYWRRGCVEDRAVRVIGRPATPRTIERARRRANAQRVRVVRPGEFYTQEFDRRRLTIEVDYDGIIVDVRCG